MNTKEFRKCHYCKVDTECAHDRYKEEFSSPTGVETSACNCLSDGFTFRYATPDTDIHLHCLLEMIDKVLKSVGTREVD